jgi:hypothetical protein
MIERIEGANKEEKLKRLLTPFTVLLVDIAAPGASVRLTASLVNVGHF